MTDQSPPSATPAGWYPDPWSSGHHRYWDGAAWTGGSFPHGPAGSWADESTDTAELPASPPAPPPALRNQSPPPPDWSPPSPYLTSGEPALAGGWPSPPIADEATKPSRLSGVGFIALVVGVMLVVGSLGTLGGYLVFRHRSTSQPTASEFPPGVVPTIPGPTPTVPRDPSATALDSLVLNQDDVASTVVVQPLVGGNRVSGETTLDLCNGTFPSESLRTARLQVAAYDAQATALLSTEAVLYANPAATEQAFAELKSVASNCPSTPVVSPVGEPTAVTQFKAAPDSAWAAPPSATPTVVRQAYDFVSTDEFGETRHSVAVYLRRGRVLMGVYFSDVDSPQITVAGQTSIEAITGVFASRLARLPASVVNG